MTFSPFFHLILHLQKQFSLYKMIIQKDKCLPNTSSTLRKYAVSCRSICLAHTIEPETGGKSLTILILYDLLWGYWT